MPPWLTVNCATSCVQLDHLLEEVAASAMQLEAATTYCHVNLKASILLIVTVRKKGLRRGLFLVIYTDGAFVGLESK